MTEVRITVKLDDSTARKIAEMAKVAGITPERLAEMVLESHFFDYGDFEWVNGDPREPLPPLDVSEPTYAWEDVKAEMLTRLERNRRRRA